MKKREFDSAEFGRRLRKLRKGSGFDRQEQLAAAAGISVQAVSAYENGDRVPSGDLVAAIANVLKCTTDYLLLKDDHPSYEGSDACKFLGITEEAAETLVEFNKRGIDLSELIVSLFRRYGIIDEISTALNRPRH